MAKEVPEESFSRFGSAGWSKIGEQAVLLHAISDLVQVCLGFLVGAGWEAQRATKLCRACVVSGLA